MRWGIVLHFGILFVPWVTSFGFRNCIQSYDIKDSYNCIYRQLLDVHSAVSDLPNVTKFLNISHNNIMTLHPGSFGHMPLLQLLNLGQNSVRNISAGAFENLTNLRSLTLSCNRISSLSPEVFHGLGNLTHLFLDHNLLASIHAWAFSPLNNLIFINVSSNQLKNFSEVVGSIHQLRTLNVLLMCGNKLTSLNHSQELPPSLTELHLCKNQLRDLNCHHDLLAKISYLDLSYNNLTASTLGKMNLSKVTYLRLESNNEFNIFKFLHKRTVTPDKIDYSGLKLKNATNLTELCDYLKPVNMSKLTLRANGIRSLPDHIFENCTPKHMDLSRNRLKKMCCLKFLKPSDLESLTVEHNLLKELSNCNDSTPFSNLQNISFQYNRIWQVKRYAFGYAPNLRELKLNINNIGILEKYALSGLRKLSMLRLDNNLITDLYENSFHDLTELHTLNLRNNRVSVIFNNTFCHLAKLRFLDLGGNKITHLSYDSLYGLQTLSNLYLDGNKIQKISRDTFSNVMSTLQVLDLKSNQLRYDSSRKHFSPFCNLSKLYDLKLQAQQPFGLTAVPHGFLEGLTSLRLLYLSQNRLTSLRPDVFNGLDQLQYLTLADDCNGIQNLPQGIFKNLKNLRILDLENICLQTLTLSIFENLSKLRRLQLMKNALKHIDVDVLKNMTSLVYLDLRKCPLTCTCNNYDLQRWLNQSQVQVVYPYNLSCPGMPFSYIHDFNMHVCDMKIKMFFFCFTFPFLLLFIVIPVVYSRTYWRLRYNYFLFVAWLHQHWKSEKELYKYDAFVSYNSHNEDWVFGELLPNLETCHPSLAFRLCLHHRDFQLGRDIIDNIVDSVHNSRKTLCVISRDYLRSEWCSLEMQLASYKLLDEMRDVLVLIFLEHITDRELSTYHKMRRVMLKKTYISWPSEPDAQKLFWAKVRIALKGSSSSDGEENQGFSLDEREPLVIS
ncbi:hypothetical protein FKM82_024709 [Ascaphus truei]